MFSASPRYWLALHPDIQRPIGGVKQMHRLCEALASCGRQATLIQDKSTFHPDWFSSSVNTISRNDLLERQDLSAYRDIVVLPETFLVSYKDYFPGLPKVIFNQNGAYTFGSGKPNWPSPNDVINIYRSPDLIHVLCVSQHDHQLLSKGLCLGSANVSLLLNPIETSIFEFCDKKYKNIAFMPRKNSVDASIVSSLLNVQPWWKDWNLVSIHNLPQDKVASLMKRSIAFLAFGHPEGFGLPLAEALSCGCALIGYSGLGGRELYELASKNGVALEVSYGDWFGFVEALSALDKSLKQSPDELYSSLLKTSNQIRSKYSPDAFVSSVSSALLKIESNLDLYSSSISGV